MAYTDPTIGDFKAYFNRDFPFGNADLTTVQDADITKALSQQQNGINQDLFNNQNLYSQGALLLAAHFLVMNLRASSQGIAGQMSWLENSKSVGAVSTGQSIPQRLLDNPELSILASTRYGTQYLAMVLPNLSGQMFSVSGDPCEGAAFFGATPPWSND